MVEKMNKSILSADPGTTSGTTKKLTSGASLVGVLILTFGMGTSSVNAIPQEVVLNAPTLSSATTSHGKFPFALRHPEHPAAELRRLSGLTWDQLAGLFEVSRRSMHFWVSGNKMTVEHEKKMQEILVTIRKIDRGLSTQNRIALLKPMADSTIPLDHLKDGNYEKLISELGDTRNFAKPAPRTSEVHKEGRLPLPIAALIDSRQDIAHSSLGERRPAKRARRESGA
jgi:hypothetical protein